MLVFAVLACQGPEDPVDDTRLVTWTGEQELAADTVVEADHTLVIEPGTTITATTAAGLVVHGTLLARGTEDAPITFTGDGWRGILFEDASVDATFEDVDDYVDGSIVEHTVIEGATRGMTITASSPYLHAVTFRNNELPATLDTIGGAGLLVREGAMPRIRDSRFEDNIANAFAFGGGLFVHHADPIVQDSVFLRNIATYGAGITTDIVAAPIVGSWFEGNDSDSEGGGVSLVSTVSAVLASTFTANHTKQDGAGVHVCVTCNPHAAPYLYDLVVTDNTSDNDDPEHGAAGIGAAFLGALADSDIHGNLRDGVPSDFGWYHPADEAWPTWVQTPTLAGDWWGTTDRTAIDATVFDGADNDAHPIVAIEPSAVPTAGPRMRVVISTRRQHYEEPGDAIPVFLTVYNPGPAATTTLWLTRNGVPFTGDLDYPGAAQLDADERWTLDLPENSVWFGKIDETTYDGTSVEDVTWQAATPYTVPVIARYITSPIP
jgi:hypothetical protein